MDFGSYYRIFIINRVYVLNDFGDQCYTASCLCHYDQAKIDLHKLINKCHFKPK